jgi:hypothetical protein
MDLTPDEPVSLKIIFIPDPTRSARGDTANDPCFIPTQKFRNKKITLPSYSMAKGKSSDRVQEWVSLVPCNSPWIRYANFFFDKQAWMSAPSRESSVKIDMEILDYSEFKSYVLGGPLTHNSFRSWLEVLREKDCMIGVPDWSIDYLCATSILIFISF